jgi:hypothetical protein
VLLSSKGKLVRADFHRVEGVPGSRVVWAQQIAGTPFARVLSSAQTEIELLPVDPDAGGSLPETANGGQMPSATGRAVLGPLTEVQIELRQRLRGPLARLGTPLVRRAANTTIEEALDGLERIVGGR